jgi:hypothetical protein
MKKLFSLHNGYNLKYNLIHPHEIFGHIYREIKSFIHRGLYGYANNDVWSLDYYLAKVISNSVRHLKEHLHGYPSGLTEDEWDEILEKIIIGFEANIKLDDVEYNSAEHKEKLKAFNIGMKLFVKYFNNLWD